jgi:hypothetical protein
MPRGLKQFLYKHSWWLAPALFGLGATAIVVLELADKFKALASLGGAVAGAYYFLQKQQLEELGLFERLFADFNKRYDRMNARLQRLRLNRGPLSGADHAVLEDYFNLCAEEFFYHTCGVIDSRVWSAWCRGMLQYLEEPTIKEFWLQEQSGASYYGLTLEAIECGARAGGPHSAGVTSANRAERALRKTA